MRIWSLHPDYLDAKGLVALWRETLLAQKVLLGKTKGYRNHPQLNRFKVLPHPVVAIGAYLQGVADEAQARGYQFDTSKIAKPPKALKKLLKVSCGQMEYEWEHLQKKLLKRDPQKLKQIKKSKKILPHSIFKVVAGPVADWEIV